jgi:hypothetical protein
VSAVTPGPVEPSGSHSSGAVATAGSPEAGQQRRPAAGREPRPGLLYGAFLAFAAVAGTLRLYGVDPFWHLAAGRWILEHRTVPTTDPFRFTHQGAPWVDHEWLFQALLAAAESLGGTSGALAVRVLLVVALAGVLLATLRRLGVAPAAAVLLGIAAILGARGRFDLRPELVTLLALALFLALLLELRRDPRWRRALPLMVLTVVWVNAHPGALVAPILAAVFMIGARLPGGDPVGASEPHPPPWHLVLGLPAALAVALLTNPYGPAVFLVPVEISRALRDLPGFNPDWLPSWVAHRPGFWLALAALAALAVVLRRAGGRADPALGLTTLALAGLGILGVRHQALFYIAGALFAGSCLVRLRESSSPPRLPNRPAPATVALLACGLAALWCITPPQVGPLRQRGVEQRFGWGIQPGLFPEAAVDRIAARGDLGPLYNDVAFGGYLLWRLFPPRQVFLDSRNEVDPGLLREVGRARQDERRWLALMERHGIDGALVRYDERPRRVLELDGSSTWRTPSALLFPPDRYALVFWDDISMLFLRRRPEREAELAVAEYRAVQPEDWRHVLTRAVEEPGFREQVRQELQRRLAEDPPSRRALELHQALGALDRQ